MLYSSDFLRWQVQAGEQSKEMKNAGSTIQDLKDTDEKSKEVKDESSSEQKLKGTDD